MTIEALLEQLNISPELVDFAAVIALIDSAYYFTPISFKNGALANSVDENLGSCKVFAFAKKHGLSKQQTLACFGSYYRDDVLGNPDGNDHQNIRNFMKTGWEGISFSGDALKLK